MKAATLESNFPLLAVENGCIVSKEADVTVAFRVELPELFSVTGSEYEAVHSAWHKAVKVLPEYSIVHKQDFFIEEKYRPETDRDDLSFLSRSFERHFNERPFLNHFCYLFLTKTTKARSRQESTFLHPLQGQACPQGDRGPGDGYEVHRSGRSVREDHERQRAGDAAPPHDGRDHRHGTVGGHRGEVPLALAARHDGAEGHPVEPGGDAHRRRHPLPAHPLDTEDLPGKVATDSRYERLSTDRSDCRLSFAAPVACCWTATTATTSTSSSTTTGRT